MVSTDNVFVFSDWGCSQRRDRGRIPRNATSFLRICVIVPAQPRLADWRQLGPTAMLA